MAAKASSLSKWESLENIGITEDLLLNVIVRGDPVNSCSLTTDHLTSGILIELH